MIEITNSFPVFIVKDIATARSFYTEHSNFNVVFANEWYLHLVSPSGVQVGFLLPNQPTQPPEFQNATDGSGTIFSLEVEDAAAAYAIAQAQSLSIFLELKSEDWGQIHFCVEDPNGVRLDIVQATEPTEEYQSGYEAE